MLKYRLNFGRGSVKATELGLRLVTRSKIPYVMFIYFFIAQLVEQRTVNPWVTRSNRVEEAIIVP